MNREEMRAAVLRSLGGDRARSRPGRARRRDVRLREELDLDSMDFLNLLVGVHQRTGIEIPEADYPKLATLDRLVAYLAARS